MGSRTHPNHPRRDSRHPSTITKYALIIISLLFWLLSVVVILVGAYVIAETKDYIKELTDLQFQPSVFILIIGVLMFIITFIGFIGAVRENTCFLKAYTIIILIIVLAVVTTGALAFVFREKLTTKVTDKLNTLIPLYNSGDKHLDVQNIIDSVQSELACCGAKDYNDWNANLYFNCSGNTLITSRCGVPFSCCKTELQDNRQCGYGVRETKTITLKERTERLKTINTYGCVEVATVWLAVNLMLIGGIAIGFLVLLLVSMFLANSLREQIKAIGIR